MSVNTNAHSSPNTFSHADFTNGQLDHKQMVTAFLTNKKKEVIAQVYNEIKREYSLPETITATLNSKPIPGGRRIDMTSVPLHWAYNPVHTVHVRYHPQWLSILHSNYNSEVYTFCSEVAEMLQQHGFKYKAHSTQSQVSRGGAFECAFKKNDTIWRIATFSQGKGSETPDLN